MAYSERRKFGNKGEDIAVRFLIMKGYKILDRNYLKKYGEIDIVAKKDNFVHFIEVKTISRESYDKSGDVYRAEDNIHPQKLKRISRAVQSYLFEKLDENVKWKFGALIVTLNEAKKTARVKFLDDLVL